MLLGVLRRSFTRRWADWLEEQRAIRQLIPTAESGESERGLKGEKKGYGRHGGLERQNTVGSVVDKRRPRSE